MFIPNLTFNTNNLRLHNLFIEFSVIIHNSLVSIIQNVSDLNSKTQIVE